jgi:hypothetical protein
MSAYTYAEFCRTHGANRAAKLVKKGVAAYKKNSHRK